jgi:transcriptional regulator GlxA family with amidase domain
MVVATHRTGGQAQYAQRPLPSDGGLKDTLEWAIGQMQRPLTVRHLARHAGMAPRTFTRRFTEQVGVAAMQWLSSQRVLEAQRLLEATTLSVDDVAEFCGFGAAGVLRVHLARNTGLSPTQYRRGHQRRRL